KPAPSVPEPEALPRAIVQEAAPRQDIASDEGFIAQGGQLDFEYGKVANHQVRGSVARRMDDGHTRRIESAGGQAADGWNMGQNGTPERKGKRLDKGGFHASDLCAGVEKRLCADRWWHGPQRQLELTRTRRAPTCENLHQCALWIQPARY